MLTPKKATTEIPLNKWGIDSLRVAIQKDKVKIINPKFCNYWVEAYLQDLGNSELQNINGKEVVQFQLDDLDLDASKVKKKNVLGYSKKGITSRFAVANLNYEGKGSQKEYVVIFVNAKMLEGVTYFEAINKSNIRDVYNYLMAQKVVYVDYDDFLDSYFSDVDYCKGFSAPYDIFKETTKHLISKVRTSRRGIVNRFSNKGGFGIEYNTRDKSTLTKPYFKLYHKTTELLSKSAKLILEGKEENDFYTNYLKEFKDEIAKGIGRIEFTLKNRKQFRKYGIEATTLRELLNEEIDFDSIQHSMFIHYTFSDSVTKEIAQKLTPMETMLLKSIQMNVEKKYSKEEIFNELLDFMPNKVAKSRNKKRLIMLFEMIDNKEQLNTNNKAKEKLNNTLKAINFYSKDLIKNSNDLNSENDISFDLD